MLALDLLILIEGIEDASGASGLLALLTGPWLETITCYMECASENKKNIRVGTQNM
jgi:hypothetical protein